MTIMEKVEKWMLARDEERWLEEYSRVSIWIFIYSRLIPLYVHT